MRAREVLEQRVVSSGVDGQRQLLLNAAPQSNDALCVGGGMWGKWGSQQQRTTSLQTTTTKTQPPTSLPPLGLHFTPSALGASYADAAAGYTPASLAP